MTSSFQSQCEELKRLAEAATPGEWPMGCLRSHSIDTNEAGGRFVHERMHACGPGHSYENDENASENTLADARFIAASNPVVVLELLRRLARAEEWLKVISDDKYNVLPRSDIAKQALTSIRAPFPGGETE